jgi:uncharacterized protein (DUF1697 family)
LGTGNVIFESRAHDVRGLERRIGGRLRAELGYSADALIRTPAEVDAIARYRPFGRIESEDERQFNIIFLANAPGGPFAKAVRAFRDDWHRLRLHGRELYWLRRKRPGTGNFTGMPLLKMLDIPYTMRGARTVVAMAAKYGSKKAKTRFTQEK